MSLPPAELRTNAAWAVPAPPPRPAPRYLLAALLFLVTLFCTTTLGAGWYLSTRTDVVTDLLPILEPRTIRIVWSDPALLATGLQFSVPVMLILLCHELGHYLTCLRYGLPATLPYFLPAPLGLGTLGAFIKIRAPIRRKAMLLDVGAAGPLAGFVALVPFLLYGIARSVPSEVTVLGSEAPGGLMLLLPGRSLAMDLVIRIFHGSQASGAVMDLHPFALAAWVGLLATALNLLPLGQLDGGHVLYAVGGSLQRRLAWILWGLLLVAGLYWRGWWIWSVIVLFMGLKHPPVVDEAAPLDRKRRLVAAVCLVLFVLSFSPIPISLVAIRF